MASDDRVAVELYFLPGLLGFGILLELLGAVGDDEGAEMAAAAYLRVAAVTAPAARWLVEVEAHCLGSMRFSVGVSTRTDIFSVVWARTNIAVTNIAVRKSLSIVRALPCPS